MEKRKLGESENGTDRKGILDKAITELCSEISQEIDYLNAKCIEDVKYSAFRMIVTSLATSDFFKNISYTHDDETSCLNLHVEASTACSLPRNTQGISLSAWNDELRLSCGDSVTCRLITAILEATVDTSLKEEASVMLKGICHHFASI